MLRTYKVGNYLVPAEGSRDPDRLDERERAVRDGAYSRTLELLTLFCFVCAGIYFYVGGKLMQPADVVVTFLMLGTFAATWPKAMILWSEPDPREEAGTEGNAASCDGIHADS